MYAKPQPILWLWYQLSQLHISLNRMITYHKSKHMNLEFVLSACTNRLLYHDSTNLLIKSILLWVYPHPKVTIT